MVRLPVQSDAPQVPGYVTTVVRKHVFDHPGTDHRLIVADALDDRAEMLGHQTNAVARVVLRDHDGCVCSMFEQIAPENRSFSLSEAP